jgi:hypothetical protein
MTEIQPTSIPIIKYYCRWIRVGNCKIKWLTDILR